MAAAKLSGATNEGIRTVLTTFTGVKHRLQFVGNFHERLFYNDSKATNILATQKALSAFKQPIILFAGGLDRGMNLRVTSIYEACESMVVFGETANKLREIADKANIKAVVRLTELFNSSPSSLSKFLRPKDVILLSPACASWDQYRTFEERGDMFIQAVHKLA